MRSKRLIILTILGLLPFIFVLVSWGVLRQGIRLERIDLAGFHAEKLYLKLDKKLLLEAHRVVIPRGKGSVDPEELQQGLSRLHRALGLFEAVEVDEVDFAGSRYQLIYRDGIIYIKGKKFEIAGMVYDRGGEMEVQFPLVRIPRYGVTLSGELHYRYRDRKITASGFYQIPDLSGGFEVSKRGARIRFRLDSMKTASLQELLKFFTMSREAKEWLGRRIAARSYQLEYLEGEGRYDEQKGAFVPDLATLRGAVRLDRPRIRFHDKLLPITARSARVLMQGGNLYFLLRAPRYGRRNLSGSQAALLNLNDPRHLKLLLRLYYRGRVDWQVLRILHVYGLKLTLGQKEGTTEARVDLDVPLGKGKVMIRGIARFGKGVLEFQKQLIPILGGEVAFTSDRLALRGVKIREPWFQGRIDGSVNLKRHQAKLTVAVKRARLMEKGTVFIDIGKRKIPVELRWSEKEWRIAVPAFRALLLLRQQGDFLLRLRKIALWKPYLRGLLTLVEDGEVTIEGAKGSDYRMYGTLLWGDSPFYTREGPIERFPFQAHFVGSALRFDALKGKIAFRSDQRVLRIDSINVNAQRLMAMVYRYKNRVKAQSSPGKKDMKIRLSVLGRKSIIRYERYVLLTDAYRLDLNGEEIRFDGALGTDHVWIEKRNSTLKIEAKKIGDRMLHSLIHFNGLQGGKYTLHLEGTESKGYTGEILIDGGVLKDVKAYNDMIALLNTLPALVSFSSPGFSAKGFEIKKGRILFTLKGQKLHLGSILLEGKSSTIAGKGGVDLQSGKLDIDLAIRTAREVGRTLGQIPMVGYILFGKDKSLTIGVKIRGTMEKPKVSTNPVGEALLYPLELLKRTLLAPAQLGGERDDELPTAPARQPVTPQTGSSAKPHSKNAAGTDTY